MIRKALSAIVWCALTWEAFHITKYALIVFKESMKGTVIIAFTPEKDWIWRTTQTVSWRTLTGKTLGSTGITDVAKGESSCRTLNLTSSSKYIQSILTFITIIIVITQQATIWTLGASACILVCALRAIIITLDTIPNQSNWTTQTRCRVRAFFASIQTR